VLSKKSLARLVACQVLSLYYDPMNADKSIESLLDIVSEHYVAVDFRDEDGKNRYLGVCRGKFVLSLLEGVLANQEKIDSRISASLHSGHSLGSLDRVLLQSLRLACFELMDSAIARKIIVSEYVDLVAEFHDRACTAFANGVLDRMASEIAGPAEEVEAGTDSVGDQP
jgi:transcription termination factor NusB